MVKVGWGRAGERGWVGVEFDVRKVGCWKEFGLINGVQYYIIMLLNFKKAFLEVTLERGTCNTP